MWTGILPIALLSFTVINENRSFVSARVDEKRTAGVYESPSKQIVSGEQLYLGCRRRKPVRPLSRLTRTMECSAAFPLMPELMAQTSSEFAATPDFDSIVQQYRPRVFRFILASLRDEDAANTLTQDCFFKAYKALASFRGECSLDTWLLKIAANLVRDYARNRRLQFWRRTHATARPFEEVESALSDKSKSAEARAVVNEQIKAVWLAAEELSERQRTVFLLRFVEDMDLLEIAAATGLKEGTVKVHLFRALQAVRARLGIAQ